MLQRPDTNRKVLSPSPSWFRSILLSDSIYARPPVFICLCRFWNLTDRWDSKCGIAFIIVTLRSSHLSRSIFFLFYTWYIYHLDYVASRFVIEWCPYTHTHTHTHTYYNSFVRGYVIRSIGRLAACFPSRSSAGDGPLYDLRGFYHPPGLLGNDFLDYLQQTYLHHTSRGTENNA
jgi:hypothetical protein